MLTHTQIVKKYGQPGNPDNLTIITTSFPLRIAWNPKQTITRISCHKLIAQDLLAVFDDLIAHYGYEQIKKLGIDLFGGCYNFRSKRGTEKKYEAAIKAKNFTLAYSYLSAHSWAIALDLDPSRNALKTKWINSQFSKPEYKPMIEIFYKHGFINYGIEKNFDSMHFEKGT